MNKPALYNSYLFVVSEAFTPSAFGGAVYLFPFFRSSFCQLFLSSFSFGREVKDI